MSVEGIDCDKTYFYVSLGLLIAINGYFCVLLKCLIQVSLSTISKKVYRLLFFTTFCFKTSKNLESRLIRQAKSMDI